MTEDYVYYISIVEDHVGTGEEIFVPNCDESTVVEILRYLRGSVHRFPRYKDGDNVIIGLDEKGWGTAEEWLATYCPRDMACIVRCKSNIFESELWRWPEERKKK